MFGRYRRRNGGDGNNGGSSNAHHDGVGSLIGGSGGISLDGRSLQVDDGNSHIVNLGSTVGAPPSAVSSIGVGRGGFGGGESICGFSTLAGESLHLPYGIEDDDYRDEVSSINSSIYQGPLGQYSNLKILGAVTSTEADCAAYAVPAPRAPSPTNKRNGDASATWRETTFNSEDPDFSRTISEQDNGSEKKKNNSTIATTGGAMKSCLPVWLRRAPTWLKMTLIGSTVLITIAVVLVTVSLVLAYSSSESQEQSTTSNGVNNSTLTASSPSVPTATTTTTTTDNESLTTSTTIVANTPDGEEVIEDKTATIENDGLDDTSDLPETTDIVSVPTVSPTIAPTETRPPIVKFLVTAGRYPEEIQEEITELMSQLPPSDFLVHLGDWNSAEATDCKLETYEEISYDFSYAPMPVFFVPGDNEYNDCDDEEQALANWRQTLLGPESMHWGGGEQRPWQIFRQVDYLENSMFVDNHVLFVTLNLVSGFVHDEDEWDARQDANIEWIQQAYDKYSQDDTRVRAIVILAHASPDYSAANWKNFFKPFLKLVDDEWWDMRFVFVHRNSAAETAQLRERYDGLRNLSVITVQGSTWPPQQATIDFSSFDDEDEWNSEIQLSLESIASDNDNEEHPPQEDDGEWR